jgi:hypothetical protein
MYGNTRDQESSKYFFKRAKWRSYTVQFQTFYKATNIKTAWYWHKNRQINGIKLRTRSRYIFGQLIFTRIYIIISLKNVIFPINGA